jgi:hypothetical protein
MAKSVNFFMDSQDEHAFADFVVSDEKVVFIPQVSHDISPPEFRQLEQANTLKNPMALQIWNKSILPRLTLDQYAPGIFSANVSNNDPIIAFRRSFSQGNVLVAGELSAEMYSLHPSTKQLIFKGKDFEQWYNALARWVRRYYKREDKYGIYIGPSAIQAAKRGAIVLAQHLTAHGPI